MRSIALNRSPARVLFALVSAIVISGCVDPLDIVTPRRTWEVNLDSLVATEPFVRGPGDSIFARVGTEDVVFATEIKRPTFHNGKYRGAHYVTIQASRQSLSAPDYDIISLRLDAVRDTGTFTINGAYSAPKYLDSMASPTYAARYERKRGGFPEVYETGGPTHPNGSLRVARIDETLGVMVGTFSFTAYSDESQITISRGAFRIQLERR